MNPLPPQLSPSLAQELSALPGAAALEPRPDGWWMTAPGLDVQAAARCLLAAQARLATITAAARPDGETDLVYHYVLGGTALNIKATTRQAVQPSIAPLLPAADWIEREIHDLYAVVFTGHPNLARLVLPPELPIGLFRQPGGAASKKPSA